MVSGAAEASSTKWQPRRGTVQTVLGPLDASKLGVTLSHEHVAEATDILKRWPKTSDARADLLAKAVDHLKAVRAAGVSTIVDLTTYDVGRRDIRFLKEVSRKSGLNMIACTGQRFFPPQSARISMPARTVAGLAEFFLRDVKQGIDGTSIKAGVVKIGIVNNPPTPLEETGLRAAVRASR